MKTVKVTLFFDVEDDDAVEALETVENHAEYLIDFDSWPEIKDVHDVTVEEV